MNAEMEQTFAQIKPVCDLVLTCPTPESIAQYTGRVAGLTKEVVQQLQQYVLYPLIKHIRSKECARKHDLQCRMIDAMRAVLDRVTVASYEMCIKIEMGLLALVFDKTKPGMKVPEELKLSVMKCFTVLMLNIDMQVRKKLLQTQVPLVAQAVYVSVHIAKLEKLKALRLAAIDSVTAHTVSHRQLTDECGRITDVPLETLAVDMLASVLPGVLAALQDAAVSGAGHAVVVAALNAIHRILCLTMNDKFLAKQSTVTAEDFAKMIVSKRQPNTEVSNKDKLPKRSAAWFAMAGEKLALVTRSLAALAQHEHVRARRELAVYCARLLAVCPKSMQPSVPTALELLLALAKDEHAELAEYAAAAARAHLSADAGAPARDCLAQSFRAMLTSLPRVLNSVDSNRKLSAMNLLHGYIEVMCDDERPQTLTVALSSEEGLRCFVSALLEAAAVQTELMLLMQHADRDVLAPPPPGAPWRRLRHLEGAAARRLWAAAAALGGARAAALLLDRLPPAAPAAAALANAIAAAPDAPPELARRVLESYIDESVWYQPLEVGGAEPSLTRHDTRDVTVYDPCAWTRESVPGLFEGATETRCTGISYATPRAPRPAGTTLAQAQANMALACALTEGVGLMAARLRGGFQPYLLRTLCLVLERVGSPYEMLHLAGVKALSDIAAAGGHGSVAELIRCNADYFTNQVSVRLKKPWNTESALQILSVVMEYSDASILDCLYGIVEDVLLQSLDKYHENNVQAYLQVFLTFIMCIRKWFPDPPPPADQPQDLEIDILKDLMEHVSKTAELERLMEEDEEKSAEEMYREDQKKNEDEMVDYDDRVTEEPPPPPRHVSVTARVLRRAAHFAASREPARALPALRLLRHGLPALRGHDDLLLPLVHAAWPALVTQLESGEAAAARRALELLLVAAELAGEFIRHRAVNDALPHIYTFLHKSAPASRLKDAGSAYRGAAPYRLQAAALAALARLPPALALPPDALEPALAAAAGYLSRKQPKPLQELAVAFFRAMLQYDYGAAWHALRRLAGNARALRPPAARAALAPALGTPYEPRDQDYEANFKLVFADDPNCQAQQF